MGRNKKASTASKKSGKIISLVKLGVKPDFSEAFKTAIKRIDAMEAFGMSYGGFWDSYADDWYAYAQGQQNFGKPKQMSPMMSMVPSKRSEMCLGGGSKRGSRGHKRGKGKKGKNLWEMGFFDELSVSDTCEKPVVYFYKDYNNPDDVECFMTLGEFDKFLMEEGIHVPEDVSLVIMNNEESHCCINPNSSMLGEVTLMANATYYGLKWDASIEDYDVSNNRYDLAFT